MNLVVVVVQSVDSWKLQSVTALKSLLKADWMKGYEGMDGWKRRGVYVREGVGEVKRMRGWVW